MHVVTDFGGMLKRLATGPVGAETAPSGYLIIAMRYPDWQLVRIMVAKPLVSGFNADVFEIGGRSALIHRLIIDLDDLW